MPVSQKIRGMTEKYVLREAARDGPHRHGLPPPEAPVPQPAGDADARTSGCTSWCRTPCAGPSLRALPFFDRRKVVALLDRLPAMDDGARTAIDPVLMILLSAWTLQQRFAPSA